MVAATNVAVTWQRRYKAYRNANVNARQKRSIHLERGAGNQQDAIDCRHLGLSSDGDCSVFKRDASDAKMMDSLIRAKGVISMYANGVRKDEQEDTCLAAAEEREVVDRVPHLMNTKEEVHQRKCKEVQE